MWDCFMSLPSLPCPLLSPLCHPHHVTLGLMASDWWLNPLASQLFLGKKRGAPSSLEAALA